MTTTEKLDKDFGESRHPQTRRGIQTSTNSSEIQTPTNSSVGAINERTPPRSLAAN
jgi:hypothetical protein